MRSVSKTAFFEAARAGDADELARMLRERPDFVALVDNKSRTALHLCSRRPAKGGATAAAAVAAAKVLLNAGADVNAVQQIPDDGQIFPATALWYALAFGRNRKLGAYLLKCKADPNHCMFALVYADDLEAAKLVRRYGARLDDRFAGETPLLYAARHRRAKFMEWLLREGADPRIGDRRGLTALHHAVRRRLPDSTLRALLKHGADPGAVAADNVPVAALATRHQKKVLGIGAG